MQYAVRHKFTTGNLRSQDPHVPFHVPLVPVPSVHVILSLPVKVYPTSHVSVQPCPWLNEVPLHEDPPLAGVVSTAHWISDKFNN